MEYRISRLAYDWADTVIFDNETTLGIFYVHQYLNRKHDIHHPLTLDSAEIEQFVAAVQLLVLKYSYQTLALSEKKLGPEYIYIKE